MKKIEQPAVAEVVLKSFAGLKMHKTSSVPVPYGLAGIQAEATCGIQFGKANCFVVLAGKHVSVAWTLAVLHDEKPLFYDVSAQVVVVVFEQSAVRDFLVL